MRSSLLGSGHCVHSARARIHLSAMGGHTALPIWLQASAVVVWSAEASGIPISLARHRGRNHMNSDLRWGGNGRTPGGGGKALRQKPSHGLRNFSWAAPYEAAMHGEVSSGTREMSERLLLLDPGAGWSIAATVWGGTISSYCSRSSTSRCVYTPRSGIVGGVKLGGGLSEDRRRAIIGHGRDVPSQDEEPASGT